MLEIAPCIDPIAEKCRPQLRYGLLHVRDELFDVIFSAFRRKVFFLNQCFLIQMALYIIKARKKHEQCDCYDRR